mgnify:CR=1 FL=1
MTFPAAPFPVSPLQLAGYDALPVPEGLQSPEVARYQAWLADAYRTAISEPVRQLISEVTAELAEVSAAGIDISDDFAPVVRGAVESVAVAIDCDAGVNGIRLI